MTSDIVLDETERDALTELVNIGVSRAASSLRKMVDRQVLLSVPAIDIVTRQMAAILLGQRETSELTVVQQEFSGEFSGRALLIFPEDNARYLTETVLGESFRELNVKEAQNEALAETGNIILTACLSSIANMLHQPLHVSLPSVRHGTSTAIFKIASGPIESTVLFLYINFAVRDRQVKGYLAMIMELPALVTLKRLIGEYIDRLRQPA